MRGIAKASLSEPLKSLLEGRSRLVRASMLMQAPVISPVYQLYIQALKAEATMYLVPPKYQFMNQRNHNP